MSLLSKDQAQAAYNASCALGEVRLEFYNESERRVVVYFAPYGVRVTLGGGLCEDENEKFESRNNFVKAYELE